MSFNVKQFQIRYNLSNKEVAQVCSCSLPTIQKWRSGEVSVSGAASQLMKLLDMEAEGNPQTFRNVVYKLNQQVDSPADALNPELDKLESSVNKVVDRLEVMLESRRKESELAESEARYRSISHVATSPIGRWRSDTTLTYVNDAYCSFTKRSYDDLVGSKWLDCVPAKRRPALAAIISDMVRCEEVDTLTEEVPDGDGRIVFMEWTNIPIKDQRGRILEWHSVGRDVTELVHLRNQVSELTEIKAALDWACDSPTLIFDNSGQFVEMNARFRNEILKDNPWKGLGDMISGKASGRLKRLLKRLSTKEEFCYQLKLEDHVLLLKGQLVAQSGSESRFAAIIEDLSDKEHAPVIQLRLEREVLIDGKAKEIAVGNEAAHTLKKNMIQLGRTVHVDRIYVFTFDDTADVFDNILEWCAEGVEPQIEGLKRIPMAGYPWWINRIKKNQLIQIEDTNKLPRGAVRERELLQAQEIVSILVAPLKLDGRIIGFVGFDHLHTPRIWHNQEVDELNAFKHSVEEALGSALNSV